ncbi:MAG TPA: hypothetical protein VMX37_01395 [Acidimicrobiia bacterium]|nr:hypothetical protein [Acidimicrobiia bacterium]
MPVVPFRVRALCIAGALLTACGSTTTADPTTTLPYTTTTSTTTTASTTTTTTLPPIPEIPLEVPAMPPAMLAEEYGGIAIDTYCEIEYVEMPDGTKIMSPFLTSVFRFMGVEHSTDDCDLALDDLVEKDRYSAIYRNIGECFTGFYARGEIVAAAGGEQWTWPVDIDHEPPPIITGCGDDEEPPGGPLPYWVTVNPYQEPLGALFGPLGTVAWAYAGERYLPIENGTPGPETYEILAAALHHESPYIRCGTAEIAEGLAVDLAAAAQEAGTPVDPLLQTLTPHLLANFIEMSASDDEGVCPFVFERALWAVTGRDFPDPRAWAEWWLSESAG